LKVPVIMTGRTSVALGPVVAALVLWSCVAAHAQPPTPAPVKTPMVNVWTGDLDELKRRRLVRILVVYSKTFYFLDKGAQHGATYELGVQFEKLLNANNKDRARPIRVAFIPVSRDRLLPSLAEGRGDLAAANLTITPERLKMVDFSAPLGSDVKEILVVARGTIAPATAEGLSGRTLYVRRSSSYFASLAALTARLEGQHKPPIKIEAADENLEDEDILEMVNAGLISATIVDDHIAEFWQQIFDKIEPHPDVVLRGGAEIAWAMRKNSPQLKAAVDGFVAKNRVGTATGNVILKRYLVNTKWARNATATEDMKRFETLSKYFQKYAGEYQFEWLLLMAQAYQESGLDQSIKSPAGAVGVMQMMPATAQDKNVNIRDIQLAEQNIHAGAKYLRFLVDQYFDEPGIDAVNRHLFAFAAYNAGPNRISRLRRDAKSQGLDPDKWFNNVEVVAAKEIGRETVQYVSNIYKYYIAYKLIVERSAEREAARRKAQ
jgi:membrane-bound lytic murein transglycosylase MltF